MATSELPVLPRLRLIRGGRSRVSSRAAAAAARRFRLAALALLVLACAGVMRVSLAARATEAAIDASNLRAELKAERLEGRVLEADKSALASPSRIELLACESLNMGAPSRVCYIELPDTDAASSEAGSPVQTATGKRGVMDTLMDLAAGEAQVLLVGDMGLGTAR